MTTTKISSNDDISKKLQDKTEWNKIYKQSQSEIDQEAIKDTENPILKDPRFKRINDKNNQA